MSDTHKELADFLDFFSKEPFLRGKFKDSSFLKAIFFSVKEVVFSLKKIKEEGNHRDFIQKLSNFSNSLKKLQKFDAYFPGGFDAYWRKVSHFLSEQQPSSQQKKQNKLEACLPKVLDYSEFDYPLWLDLERLGKRQACRLGWVILTGGMGERLGYDDIKVNISLELGGGKSFLQLYLEMQLAIRLHIQQSFGQDVSIPIVLVISHITRARVETLLRDNDFYGVKKEEIYILEQPAYPAVKNDRADLDFDDDFCLIEKPSGHGRVHSLLVKSGALEWLSNYDIKTLVFFQDTNFQIFQHLFVVLGAFARHKSDFAFLGIQRDLSQKMGVLAEFSWKKKKVVRSIEDHLLDDYCFSQDAEQYLSNTNTLLTHFDVYRKVVQQHHADLPYFINPKYDTDGKKFLKSARLEQLIQDISLFFSSQDKVHVYHFPRRFIFSAVKNKINEDKNEQIEQNAMSALNSEQKFFETTREKLRFCGNVFYNEEEKGKEQFFLRFDTLGKVVLPCYHLATLDRDQSRLRGCIFHPYSYLVIQGQGDFFLDNVVFHRYAGLTLDLARGVKLMMRDVSLDNHGYDFHFFKREENVLKGQNLRGFSLVKKDWRVVKITEPGEYFWTLDEPKMLDKKGHETK